MADSSLQCSSKTDDEYNLTFQLLYPLRLAKKYDTMAYIAGVCVPCLRRGSLFAATRLLQTVRLDTTCITNDHHCSSIPACVHFAHRVGLHPLYQHNFKDNRGWKA